MMNQVILDFAKQFRFAPKIENGPLRKYKKFIVAGMGGSALAASILKTLKPELDIVTHRDYGLPFVGERDLKKTLVIASSYSGNTEETLSALEEAQKRGLAVVCIAVGGKLLEIAKGSKLPYIELPNTGIQPRSALGFSMKAMLKAMKQSELLKESRELVKILKPKELEQAGKDLAERIRGHFPVIYASRKNCSVAYNWKIKFNETGKTPAFFNVFPELNHNEMTGFDVKDTSSELSAKTHFIFLKDSSDHPQIQKRMDITAKLYKDRGLPVEILELKGENETHKVFSSLVTADWAAFYTAEGYGLESEQVPMVEEFKGLIK